MVKKLLCAITVSAIVLSALLPITAENSSTQESTTTAMRMQPIVEKYNNLTQESLNAGLAKYHDIKNHWGRNHIAKISALEIISGYPDGSFRPDDKLLGGQYVLMLMRAIGYRPEVPQGVPYYKPFVDLALKEGILTKGEISDYTKPITRELAASLARRTIAKYEKVPTDYFIKGTDTEGKGDKGFFDNVYVGYQKLKMTDYPTITDKYLQDVFDCFRIGLLTGSNNKFNPKGTLTRAEASVIIIKLLDKKVRVESIPSSSESFKWKNSNANNGEYDNEAAGFYENKEYTLYKGLFPMMEIWETAQAMYKNRNLITGGKIDFTYSEKNKSFSINYYNDQDHFGKVMNNNYDGLFLPLSGIGIATQRTQIKKGQRESLYDNCDGWLYEILSYEVDKYNKDLKKYTYELLKLWFGKDYEQAKKIHDQYLDYGLKDIEGKIGIYLLNGRQIYVVGGNGDSGDVLSFKVWAKGYINKNTMLK